MCCLCCQLCSIVTSSYIKPMQSRRIFLLSFLYVSSTLPCSTAHPPIQVAFNEVLNKGEGHYKAGLLVLPFHPLTSPNTFGCSLFQPFISLFNQSPLSPIHSNRTTPPPPLACMSRPETVLRKLNELCADNRSVHVDIYCISESRVGQADDLKLCS